jgi:hypothetical protein
MTQSNIASLLATPPGWLVIAAAGCIYWLPSIIGGTRHVRTFKPLVAVNLLLGWTVLGWVVALVMGLWPASPARAYVPVNDGQIR